LFAAIDPADDSDIIHRQPIGGARAPARHVGAADKIELVLREGGVNARVPTGVNLFVVIDHADEIALTGANACIERRRAPLLSLEEISQTAREWRAPSLDHIRSLICAVVVDDRDTHVEPLRHNGLTQTPQRLVEQSGAIKGRNNDVQAHWRFKASRAIVMIKNTRPHLYCYSYCEWRAAFKIISRPWCCE